MLTEADLKRFAPKAAKPYVDALLAGADVLREAGILENEHRLVHFMAQFGAETGGGTVLRESLYYTTANRLRQVWPARFRNKSDAELRPLLKNEVALGDAVYMGRMGNDKPGDGYAYRGGGFIQTTGKSAVKAYAAKLKIRPAPALLDDHATTLRFACLEWKESGCNQWADQNDIVKVSKAINTGSATSNVQPVGMADRRAWFAKAWGVWGDKGKPDSEPLSPISKKVVTTISTVAGGAVVGAVEGVKSTVETAPAVVAAAPPVPAPSAVVTDTVNNVGLWKGLGETVFSFGTFAVERPFLVGGIVLVVAVLLVGPKFLPASWRP